MVSDRATHGMTTRHDIGAGGDGSLFKARSVDVKLCGWIPRERAIRKINFNGTRDDKWHPVSKDECSGVVTCQIYHEHLCAIELQRSNVQHFINSPPTSRDLRHLDENGSPKKVEYFSRNLALPSLTGLVQKYPTGNGSRQS